MPNKNSNQYYNSTIRIKTAGSSSTNQSMEKRSPLKITQNRNMNLVSPISNFEHMPKIVEPYKLQLNPDSVIPDFYDKRIISASVVPPPPINRPVTSSNPKSASSQSKVPSKLHDYLTWKSDLKKIYGHYSIMVSPSYRVASAYVPRPTSELDLQSSQILEDNSKSSLENSNPNMNATNHNPSNEKPKSHSSNSTPTSVNNGSNVTNTVQYNISTTSGNSENSKEKTTKLEMFLIPGSILNSKSKSSHTRMKIVTDSSNSNN